MKKLSCFALVAALLVTASAAFAMPNSDYLKLAPYDKTAEYDMFTISADLWMPVMASAPYSGVDWVDWAANKSIKSPDIVGLTFYMVSSDMFPSSTAFKLGAFDDTVVTKANMGDFSRFWSNDVYPDHVWESVLLRTTMYASGQGNDESVKVPLKVYFDDGLDKAYTIALAGTGTNELVCTYPCCGVNFNIDCCAPAMYADIQTHTLKIWFDDPARMAVYCCPGVPFTVVEGFTDLGKIGSADIMTVPFTVARLNPDQNMIRVRVDTNFRDDRKDPTDLNVSWFEYLDWGMYADTDLCTGTEVTFWPWKQELVCTPDTDKYYWEYGKPSTVSADVPDDRYRGTAAFWKTKDHIELTDVKLGQTLNLGVWYGGANQENYSSICSCEGVDQCSVENETIIPRINIQNLGTERLNVIKCHADPEEYGICAADCGLCDTLSFDLQTSRDAGDLLGYSDAVYKQSLATALLPTDVDEAYSGIFNTGVPANDALVQKDFLTAAFRWGDFFHLGESYAERDDIITYDCPCYIYPAFTKTVQPMANKDFDFEMADGLTTFIKGRWNTNYFSDRLQTTDASSLCGVPDCGFLFTYYPCGCESTVVVNTLEKNVTSLIGKLFINERECWTPGKMADLKLEGAINVIQPASVSNDMVIALKADEGTNLLWYNFFQAKEWDWGVDCLSSTTGSAKVTPLQGILPVQLRFEIDYSKISGDIDINDLGWRDRVWDMMTLKTRNVDGTVNDIMSDRADGKAILEKLSFVTVLPVDEVKTTGHVAVTKLHIFLTVFVVDGPSPDGKAFHYYKVDETGNNILFVFDGKHDDVYKDIVYVAKPSTTPCSFNVTGTTNFVAGTSTTLTANCLPTGCIGMLWTLSSDVAEIDGLATEATVTVKGLKAGTATIHVAACDVSKDVTLTVTTPTPTVTPTTGASSSSGGCNAGAFAPLALLLIAPVVLLLKK